MNTPSAKEQLSGLVQTIVHKRMRSHRGKTNAEFSIHNLDWDRMASPEVFCDPSSVENPSFALVLFYDLLSRSDRADQEAFISMVIINVVDDPHCECASDLDRISTLLSIPESVVEEYLVSGIIPGPRALKRAEARAKGSWPTTGEYALA